MSSVAPHGWPLSGPQTLSCRLVVSPWGPAGHGEVFSLLETWFIVDFQEHGGGCKGWWVGEGSVMGGGLYSRQAHLKGQVGQTVALLGCSRRTLIILNILMWQVITMTLEERVPFLLFLLVRFICNQTCRCAKQWQHFIQSNINNFIHWTLPIALNLFTTSISLIYWSPCNKLTPRHAAFMTWDDPVPHKHMKCPFCLVYQPLFMEILRKAETWDFITD